MKAIDRLAVIRHKSILNKNWRHKDLFRILRKNDIWITAYKTIKINNGSMNVRTTKGTLDEISIKRLVILQNKVLDESYQFNSVNEFEISKSNTGKSLVRLSIADDKIVQEVIRMVLEAIYEPCFSKQNFGLGQEFGIHDTLEYIESKFYKINWVLESCIEDPYSTIDHRQLCNILEKKIQDVRFMNLIRRLLKCGAFHQGQFTRSSLGIPQGNIVLPIFTNIYFNELDKWVKNKVNILHQSITSRSKKEYSQRSYQIAKKTEQMRKLGEKLNEYQIPSEELKDLKIESVKFSNSAQQQIQIEYVRYAGDWMIGIKGDETLAKKLKLEVYHFLIANLKQTINPTKIKIINLSSGKAKFLQYEIYLAREYKICTAHNQTIRDNKFVTKLNPKLKFDIPMDSILQNMEKRGYIKKLVKGYRPISKANYTVLEDIIIVKHFAHVWKGLANYYSGCTNFSKLQYIQSLLHISCAMTLSHRHRSSTKKVFKKFGKEIKLSSGNIFTYFPYTTNNSKLKRNWLKKKFFTTRFFD